MFQKRKSKDVRPIGLHLAALRSLSATLRAALGTIPTPEDGNKMSYSHEKQTQIPVRILTMFVPIDLLARAGVARSMRLHGV